MKNSRGRELGMDRPITRRDFLNGFSLLIGGTVVRPDQLRALGATTAPGGAYYPPALTGLRGDHVGSFEAAHSLRDGTLWEHAEPTKDTGERYDLVVVGGGISGLAAAHFFRKAAGTSARILILDNHDDFGGHAKRNEFRAGNRRLLGYGGTFAIESPAPYSSVAMGLVKELGIDVARWPQVHDGRLYSSLGLGTGVLFDRENFGIDRLVRYSRDSSEAYSGESALRQRPSESFLTEAPIAPAGRRDLTRLFDEEKDYYPGLSSAEKNARLARISYASFLTQVVGCHLDVARLFQTLPQSLFGVGIDAVSALDMWGLGYPGFQGMKLDPAPGPGMNRDAIRNEEADKQFFHFPDGNASIARLLVRNLLPKAIPGRTSDDVLTAKVDYALLDERSSPVRIRLNSTVVRVEHRGSAATAREVEVTYVQQGRLHTVRGANCVLACWHMVIPYLCPEFPAEQKAALADAAKVPIVYTNVAITNWVSFRGLGVKAVYAPGCYYSSLNLDLPVSLGGYECSQRPEQPIVVHMLRTPCRPGLPARDQHREGRIDLFQTSFEKFEREIRDQLGRALGPGGFDPARDIAAITVNRWPHGYAYQYNSLWDKFWLEGGE